MLPLRSFDGTSIAYRKSGSGASFVLISGATNDHTYWDKVAGLLAKHGTVYALDRRGRGASGDKPGSTVDDEIDDVCTLLALAGGDVTLIGHSSGALLALRAAARGNELRAVVAYEPPPAVAEVSWRLRELADAGDREGALATFMTESVGMPARAVDGMRGTPSWEQGIALAHTLAYDAAIVEQGLSTVDAAKIAVPVRLLLGTQSADPMAANVRRIQGLLPNAQLRPLEGQQHFAIAAAPDLFVEQVRLGNRA